MVRTKGVSNFVRLVDYRVNDSRMKIRCTNPNHKDETPSMSVYADGAYCFSCGYSTNSIKDPEYESKPKENLEGSIAYIQSLPTKSIRGLSLPSDDQGYYILWPDRSYYKKRLFEGKSRYIGPRGFRAPLLKLGQPSDRVCIVEGELNALSIGLVYNGTILSPGAASNFMNYRDEYLTTKGDFTIVVDKDIPGVVAGLKLKEFLLKNKRLVSLVAKKTDYNQILQDEGQETLLKTVLEDMGLSTQV